MNVSIENGKKEKARFKVLRYTSIVSVLFPFALLIIAYYMKQQGFKYLIPDYEKGSARMLQYILFFIGVVIFFFCDGISDFIANKLFIKNEKQDKEIEKENISSYFTYTLVVLWLLNLITITGFIGFLICGNMSWLSVFLLLNISMVYKYFPSQRKYENLIRKLQD